MDYTQDEVLSFVQENDVKFVRLAFCDLFGRSRNIAIMADELPRAFHGGVSFDASAVPGFMKIQESDLFLQPDPATLAVLPWRPQQGRVARLLCDVHRPDGKLFEGGTGRELLRSTVQEAYDMGLSCQVGVECEFYLFQMDEAGCPTHIPQDRAGYLDMAPKDKGENVRREICLMLEQMGIRPESCHHEAGPGQNEIVLRHTGALEAADWVATLKPLIRAVAARNGLHACFLPKPLPDFSGSGMHINMSLFTAGGNLFRVGGEQHSPQAESFIAGILRRAVELTALLNPMPNSYQRLGQHEAPGFVSWSHQNRSQLIRIPAAQGEYARMELRSPDPSCNPYLAIALLLKAGLQGIEDGLPLEQSSRLDLYSAGDGETARYARLPQTLLEAVEAAEQSAFVQQALPQRARETLFAAQRAACQKAVPCQGRGAPLEDLLFDI